jgi:hypothetical protein
MKRKSLRHWAMPFSARVIKPINKLDPDLFRLSLLSGYPSVRPKKIFVIKQTGRLQPTNAKGKEVQRILIFDNHPASIRLVFEHRAKLRAGLSVPPRATSWELTLVTMLAVVLLIAMLAPIL